MELTSEERPIALFFDLMGTCCDWLSSMLPLLQSLPEHESLQPKDARLSGFAIDWREGFFQEIHDRFKNNKPAEDIDVTHRRVLDQLLSSLNIGLESWNENHREALVQQWHKQMAWPDVISAFQKMRLERKCFLIVLANGTTRLQLDIASSSNIPFHMLMSSELLGMAKPCPEIYQKAMRLVGLPTKRCWMIASHLYDLEAAKKVGMRTIYVHRTTEDVGIDIDLDDKHAFVDKYFDGRKTTEESGGFVEMVRFLLSYS